MLTCLGFCASVLVAELEIANDRGDLGGVYAGLQIAALPPR